ncbi:hypothetical protein HYV81_02885 [Candidatus Woesearchaeota archaeon]|nr:hypothetical protein [Candidatus Woesearchaeota archaeon]
MSGILDDYVKTETERKGPESRKLAEIFGKTLANSAHPQYLDIISPGRRGLVVLRLPEDATIAIHSTTGNPHYESVERHATSLIERMVQDSRRIEGTPVAFANVIDWDNSNPDLIYSVGNAMAQEAISRGVACLNGERANLGVRIGMGANVMGTMVTLVKNGVYPEGPNTGGMAATSDPKVVIGHQDTIERIIQNFANGLADEGIPYNGIVYFGGKITDEPMLNGFFPVVTVETNSRNGDPERKVFKISNFTEFIARASGNDPLVAALRDDLIRVDIVAASAGYSRAKEDGIFPSSKDKRMWIRYNAIPPHTEFFSYNTKLGDDGILRTTKDGSRLFSFVTSGFDVVSTTLAARQAMSSVFAEDNCITWRFDVSWRDVQRALKGGL